MKSTIKREILRKAQIIMDQLIGSKTGFGRFFYLMLFKIRSLYIFLADSNNIFMNQFIKVLRHHKIDLIVDVGAGEGEFGFELIRAGYKGSIISIEPLPDAYNKLSQNSRLYKKWIIFPRMAVGSVNKKTEINVSKNSVSSSILEMLPSHLKVSNHSAYIRKEDVDIYKLDTFIHKFKKYNNILIKIDAQGYENNILNGAKQLIKSRKLKGLFIEMSFLELYKGQKTFECLYPKLTRMGFRVWGTDRVLIDNSNGRLMQSNFLMIKGLE